MSDDPSNAEPKPSLEYRDPRTDQSSHRKNTDTVIATAFLMAFTIFVDAMAWFVSALLEGTKPDHHAAAILTLVTVAIWVTALYVKRQSRQVTRGALIGLAIALFLAAAAYFTIRY